MLNFFVFISLLLASAVAYANGLAGLGFSLFFCAGFVGLGAEGCVEER